MDRTEARPETPTPMLVRQYVHRFDDGRDGLIDKALLDLFSAFPENTRFEHILFKVLGLNALDSTGVVAVQAAARHILSLGIDARLAVCDPELVNAIALTPVKTDKTKRFYAFATKYCSWHMPAGYPIFDNVVGKIINEYQRVDQFADFFWQNEIARDYLKFKQTVEAFRDHYGLGEFTFKDLDKFLWRYSKDYFGKSA